jgi:hypothetical protein
LLPQRVHLHCRTFLSLIMTSICALLCMIGYVVLAPKPYRLRHESGGHSIYAIARIARQ